MPRMNINSNILIKPIFIHKNPNQYYLNLHRTHHNCHHTNQFLVECIFDPLGRHHAKYSLQSIT